ncbi:sensor histidine kinase [Parasphingorhabdus pacifica]
MDRHWRFLLVGLGSAGVSAALVVGWRGRFVRELSRVAARERMVERRRIARELHDVAGHRLLAIVLHARRLAVDVPETRSAAERIEELAVLTRRDVRDAVGALRSASQNGDTEVRGAATDRGSSVGDRSLSAGAAMLGADLPDVDLVVRLDNAEAEGDLGHGLRLAALRILQEGVANAIEHGSGPISVRVRFGPELDMLVRNRATAGLAHGAQWRSSDAEARAPGGKAGWGLTGLRERAAELGGHVQCVESPDGGFCLRVRIPAGSCADPAGSGADPAGAGCTGARSAP